MKQDLSEKIEHSIQLIKKAEKLALLLSPNDGFWVGFSGGKDSQCVLELVQMAGVKFRAIYNVTTIDPADNIRFIKKYYPNVYFKIPKKSFFSLIEQNGVPTMFNRWCCSIFKESTGAGHVVLTGVRKEESLKRSQYEEANRWSKNKKKREKIDLDQMEANEFKCVGGKDRFMVYPILNWTEKDIWDFIALRGLPINPCYKSRGRVGCVFCPFAKPKDIRTYLNSHPQLKKAFIRAIERYRENKKDRQILPTAEDYFEWWLSHESLNEFLAKKRQISMSFEE